MNTKLNRSPAQGTEQGTTLVEVMVTAMLVAVFFASIFELNAMCLRFIDASKESLAALQSVQDRSETLRNLSFSDLTILQLSITSWRLRPILHRFRKRLPR